MDAIEVLFARRSTGRLVGPPPAGDDLRTILRAAAAAPDHERLFTLPPETVVLPGHGKDTTIGAERPHLQEWADRGW